jgi:hypothetical protein
MKHLLPAAKDVKQMLSMIFGDGLAVSEPAGNPSMTYSAVYVDESGETGAVIACDASFAANAGAALSMLPPGAAEDAARSDELPDTMRDNLYEVMNICTRLLIDESTPHLRLTKLCRSTESNAEASIKASSSSSNYTVDIPQYGAGGLSFIVT